MSTPVDASLRRTLDGLAHCLRRRRLRTWLLGAAWVGLIVVAYFLLWRPVRVWFAQDVAAPALALVAEGRADLHIERLPGRPRVDVRGPAVPINGGELRFWIDGGRIMLLPMMILALLFPRRPYWLYPWPYHVAIIGASFAAVLAGAAGLPGGLRACAFIHGYVMPVTTLAFPLLVLLFAQPFAEEGGRERSSGGRPASA